MPQKSIHPGCIQCRRDQAIQGDKRHVNVWLHLVNARLRIALVPLSFLTLRSINSRNFVGRLISDFACVAVVIGIPTGKTLASKRFRVFGFLLLFFTAQFGKLVVERSQCHCPRLIVANWRNRFSKCFSGSALKRLLPLAQHLVAVGCAVAVHGFVLG